MVLRHQAAEDREEGAHAPHAHAYHGTAVLRPAGQAAPRVGADGNPLRRDLLQGAQYGQGTLLRLLTGGEVHHAALSGEFDGLLLPAAHVGGAEVPDGQIRGLQQVVDQPQAPLSGPHMDMYHPGLPGGEGPQPYLTGHVDELLQRGVSAPVVGQGHLHAQDLREKGHIVLQ